MSLFKMKSYMDIIILSSGFMTFLPLLLGYSLKNEYGDYPEYFDALQNFPVKSSLVAGIAACAPYLIDLLLDQFSTVEIGQKYLPRKIIISALIIPDVLYLFYIIPYRSFDLVICLACFRDTLFHYVILSHMNKLKPEIFTRRTTILLATLVMVLNVLFSFFPFLFDPLQFYVMFILVEFFVMLATTILIYLCCKWFSQLYYQRHEQSSIQDQTCTLYLLAYTVLFFVDFFSSFYPDLGNDLNWINGGAYFFTLYNYTSAASITLISAISARFTRIESEQSKSKMRKMFVSYFCHEMNTPLNAAVMGVQLLKTDFQEVREEAQAAYREVVADISNSCSHLKDILSDLVINEKVESSSRLHSKKFPGILPCPIILEALDNYQELASHQNVEMVVHNCAAENYSRCVLHTDKDFIRQILRVVLSTAIESAGTGGRVDVTLTLRAMQNERDLFGGLWRRDLSEQEAFELCLEVRDDGPTLSATANDYFLPGKSIDFDAGVLEMGRLSCFGHLVTRKLIEHFGGSFTYSPIKLDKRVGLNATEANNDCNVNSRQKPFGNFVTVTIPVILSTTTKTVSSCQSSKRGKRPLVSFGGRSQRYPEDTNPANLNSIRLMEEDANTAAVSRTQAAKEGKAIVNSHISERNERLKPIPQKREISSARLLPVSGRSGMVMSGVGREKDDPEDNESRRDRIIESKESQNSQMTVSLPNTSRAFKALVVDDSAINRKMLVRLIQSVCGTIECAEDGQEGIEVFQRAVEEGNPFDVVLMDYQMPRMDGPSAAKVMRDMGFRGPIIGVTGNVLEAHTETFLAKGANRVLLKPVKPEELLATISDFILLEKMRNQIHS